MILKRQPSVHVSELAPALAPAAGAKGAVLQRLHVALVCVGQTLAVWIQVLFPTNMGQRLHLQLVLNVHQRLHSSLPLHSHVLVLPVQLTTLAAQEVPREVQVIDLLLQLITFILHLITLVLVGDGRSQL